MWAILAKDLTIEFRTRAGLAAVFVLGLLVLVVFQLAMPGDASPETAAAALWLAFLLAGTLGVQRTFLLERENLCLQGLLAAPLDPSAVYLAKTAGNVLTLALLQVVVAALIAVLFGVTPGEHPFWFALVLLLGNLGFSATATLFAAVSVQMRLRETLLPILLFPLLAPVLIAAVRASALLLGEGTPADARVWIQVLVAFDAVFSVAGWLLFEYVVRE